MRHNNTFYIKKSKKQAFFQHFSLQSTGEHLRNCSKSVDSYDVLNAISAITWLNGLMVFVLFILSNK